MTEAGNATVRVELDLVADSDPIQGRARGADGVTRMFSGWLELVEVLDSARIGRPSSSGRATTEERP
ncbi:hypothetical protein [Lentzea californiensis]|uniref:hypothetical protein n=1 Tax=Lentzea californiensis TaxID=438851 RepID=UPI002165DEB8|nr:hypothetical protein [Lentzea californiensis]MCR3754303.1 hypothetical protein [Lentzea californiensis]